MKVVLVPSGQGSLGKNEGSAEAPQAISEGVVPNSESVAVVPNNLEETNQKIFEKAKAFPQALFLGGDHSITHPLFKAFAENFKGKKIGLLCFDAHADCAQNFSPPSHEDWLRVLVEEKIIPPENAFFIGVRKVFDVEKEWLKNNPIKFFEGKESLKKFLQEVEVVYLSIDIDAFDPSIAPGTHYTEKDGLGKEEFFELLSEIMSARKVKAVDLVEVNPEKDVERKTVNLAREITLFLTRFS